MEKRLVELILIEETSCSPKELGLVVSHHDVRIELQIEGILAYVLDWEARCV